MEEIEANDFNLNISRYVSTAEQEVEIDLAATHGELVKIEEEIREATMKHNTFLKELGLNLCRRPESKVSGWVGMRCWRGDDPLFSRAVRPPAGLRDGFVHGRGWRP